MRKSAWVFLDVCSKTGWDTSQVHRKGKLLEVLTKLLMNISTAHARSSADLLSLWWKYSMSNEDYLTQLIGELMCSFHGKPSLSLALLFSSWRHFLSSSFIVFLRVRIFSVWQKRERERCLYSLLGKSSVFDEGVLMDVARL